MTAHHDVTRLPVAGRTWTLSMALANTTAETPSFEYAFNRPIRIVGMKATVISAGGAGIVPTAEDVEVQFKWEADAAFTEGRSLDGKTDSDFVDASALDPVRAAFDFSDDHKNPKIKLKARWALGSGATYRNALVRLTLFGDYT